MQQRALGRSGIRIAPLVFGGNVFGWTVDEATTHALLDRFMEQGFNAIDTADIYSNWVPGHQGGESETLIGNWLKRRGRRDDVVLISKVGLWAARPGLSAANIEAALDDSLRRLQTDYLDVYMAHTDDAATPLEETLEAFERLRAKGKVRCLGASNYGAERLQAALSVSGEKGWARYEVLEPLYNLYDREAFENALAQVAQREELGVICYFGLANGFLSGKYRSLQDLEGSARKGLLQKYFDDRGMRILDALDQVASQVSAKPAQVALAWLASRPGVTAPIVSATSLAQLDEILDAVRISLPEDAMQRLNEASA